MPSNDHTEIAPSFCVIGALRYSASRIPNNAALLAPGRSAVSYAELLEQVEHTVGLLNGFGLKRGSRVLIVIPNGPELISAILATMCACTAIPLNPEISADEFTYLLQRSKADALIVLRGMATPAREIAHAQGIRVIELIETPDAPAGHFELEGAHYVEPTFSEPEDVAMLVGTSGTTGLPKLVPSYHKRLFERLYDPPFWGIMASSPDNPKVGISMLPMFHIFGLSDLNAGIGYGLGIIATAGFNVDDFYTYLDTYHPMGLQLLPSMLKAIVEKADSYPDIISRSSLLYISSASAPLSAELAADLQRIFHIVLIMTYGMTEIGGIAWTSTRMPGLYKPGSVGKPVVEIGIMGEDGSLLPTGAAGEVVVRKTDLFPGYEGDADASRLMVKAGWFHTGDAGYLDEENFLFLTGRLKETINRGGEKISPYEVEQTLLQHPAVKEAAVFGVPHLALGEDLAGAVVVSDPLLTAKVLRKFAAERLSPQKVPGTLLLVDEIPKTPTGKVRRTVLPQLLGLANPEGERIEGRSVLAPPVVAPSSETERTLLPLWMRILGLPEISIHDDFFDALGGTSLQAAQLVIDVGKTFSITLPVTTLLEAPTIAEMATLLDSFGENSRLDSNVIPIQPLGHKAPLFCLPAISGQAIVYRPLALHLGVDQPVYGLQMPGSDGKTPPFTRFEALAAYFVEAIRVIQPHGPYLLAGHSLGGIVALEMAQQLEQRGEDVPLLILFDTALGSSSDYLHPAMRIRRLSHRLKHHQSKLAALQVDEQAQYIFERVKRLGKPRTQAKQEEEELLPGVEAIRAANIEAMRNYQPKPYTRPIIYFSTRQRRSQDQAALYELSWKDIALGEFEICDVPGTHTQMLQEPNVQVLAEKLKSYIDQAVVQG